MVHTLLKETACPWRNLRRIYSWWVLLTALVTENKAEVQAEEGSTTPKMEDFKVKCNAINSLERVVATL